MKQQKFAPEELKNSKRIYKSVTPKYTLDWYDLVCSIIGIGLWLWVSILWKDRALVLLNGVGLMFLLRNFFVSFMG